MRINIAKGKPKMIFYSFFFFEILFSREKLFLHRHVNYVFLKFLNINLYPKKRKEKKESLKRGCDNNVVMSTTLIFHFIIHNFYFFGIFILLLIALKCSEKGWQT
jgi:hypothetical protein